MQAYVVPIRREHRRWGEYAIAPREMIPLDHPAIPQPGPDFLAEARRQSGDSTFDAGTRADYMIANFLTGLTQGVPHEDLDAKWEKGIRSKAEKTRTAARTKLVKLIQRDHDAIEWRGLLDQIEGLYRLALYGPGFSLPVLVKSRKVHGGFVPGHSFDPQDDLPGPRPASVMVVGKHPGSEEAACQRNLVGKSARELLARIEGAGLKDQSRGWYVTNLVKHPLLDPSSDSLPVAYVKNCLPLLKQELLIVRPDFVLCLGADPAKHLMGDSSITVTGSRNKVHELEIPEVAGKPAKTAKLVVMTNPAAAIKDPMLADEVTEGFQAFVDVMAGRPPGKQPRINRRHVVVYNERRLAQVVDEIVARPDGDVIAMDCEWHGEWWQPEGYLLTIQFSPRAGEAFVVRLRSQGGKPAFRPNEEAAFAQLRRLLKSTPDRPVRVGGHFFRADLPWLLEKAGIDLRDEFSAPETPEATRTAGGFDTAYMIHSVFEDKKHYGLEPWAVRMLGVHRYDEPIDEFIAGYCKDEKIKKGEIGGYGMIPDRVLDPYAALDADVVRELFDVFNGVGGRPGLLDFDKYELNSRAPFRTSQGAQLGFLEMEMRGMLVDRGRVDEQVKRFSEAYNRELAELQEMLGWDGRDGQKTLFNPRSDPQVREILFGEEFSGKVDKVTGKPVRIRPDGVPTFNLTPTKTTGARGTQWEKVVDAEEEDLYNPSADAETLGILGQDCEVARKIRNVRFLAKILGNPLNAPMTDASGAHVKDHRGFNVYKGGFMKFIAPDDRVRTKFFPLETGRYSSSKPNLQNWSSSREDDYKALLRDRYLGKLRACFKAAPGHVIVKTDLKSAELLAVARQANDVNMIHDVSRAMLPEDHPDYVDQHSAAAVAAFKLDCPPTKDGLKSIGQQAKRKAAKNQKFGALYGRGIAALVRQCHEEGTDITAEEMQAIQDAFEERCPDVIDYLHASAARSQEPGFITTALGRHRRSAPSDDRSVRGSSERSFMNVPIQGLVADVVSTAMERLHQLRDVERKSGSGNDFHFMLQLHDELDFEVPIHCIGWFRDLLKRVFDSIKVPICDLDGIPIPALEPFNFEIDTTVYLYWGETVTAEAALAAGIDPALLGADD